MRESEGQENMILTSRSLASKNYFFVAGFFGAAVFGAAFFGAGFFGAAFAIIPSFWSGVSIPFVIILFIVSYQENVKPPGLPAPGDPPSAHCLSIGASYEVR
jgi:hypothetical protein